MPIGSITSSIASPIASQAGQPPSRPQGPSASLAEAFGVGGKADPASSISTGQGASAQSVGFGDSLAKLVNSVDSSANAANVAVEQMLGGTGEVHDAMIALQRAELTLQLTVQVRNKLVQAYQDIMRMPV